MSDAWLRDLGQRIAQVRGAESQTALGKRLGVSQGAVSGWETGEKRIPVDKLAELAAHYGVRPGWLLTGEGPPEVREPSEAEELLDQIEAILLDRLVARARGVLREWPEGAQGPPEKGGE